MPASDTPAGAQLPTRVQVYIDALIQTCAGAGTRLVSVVLFGSAANHAFSGNVSDVDVIIVVSDDVSRAERRRLGEAVARLEVLHELRPAAVPSPGSVQA